MATFEEKLAIAIELNKKLVAGDTVGRIATESLIRADGISDEDLEDLVYLYPKWEPGLPVEGGDLYRHNDKLYELIVGQEHTTQSDWAPDVTPALWLPKMPTGVIEEWGVRNLTTNPFMTGEQVIFEGQVWESTIDTNSWTPTEYPAGWKLA